MSAWVVAVEPVLLAALIATFLVVSLSAVVLIPALAATIGRLGPAARSHLLLVACVAPVGISALLVASSFVPALLAVLGLAHDHCHRQPAALPHVCGPEVSDLPIGYASLLAAGLALLLLALAIRAIRALVSERLVHTLEQTGRYDPRRRAWLLDVERPVVFSAGLHRVQTFISSRLVDVLPAQTLAIVLAHERAHARRRDPLRLTVASICSSLHLPAVRRWLMAELRLATEQCCDEASVACSGGDRLEVAQAILHVERLCSHPHASIAGATGFLCSDVVRRVQALLDPSTRPLSRSVKLLGGAAALSCCSVAAAALHWLVERSLGWLA